MSHAVVAAPLAVLGSPSRGCWLCRCARSGGCGRPSPGSLRRGPAGSTIVAHDGLLLALTRFGRLRILVSGRALSELNERSSRPGSRTSSGTSGADTARSLRPPPAGRARPSAAGNPSHRARLRFQLEHDADHFAVRELDDSLSLASAICKAAGADGSDPAFVTLSGSGPAVLRCASCLPARRADPRGAAACSGAHSPCCSRCLPRWRSPPPAGAPRRPSIVTARRHRQGSARRHRRPRRGARRSPSAAGSSRSSRAARSAGAAGKHLAERRQRLERLHPYAVARCRLSRTSSRRCSAPRGTRESLRGPCRLGRRSESRPLRSPANRSILPPGPP
jgi:hypothetical protein